MNYYGMGTEYALRSLGVKLAQTSDLDDPYDPVHLAKAGISFMRHPLRTTSRVVDAAQSAFTPPLNAAGAGLSAMGGQIGGGFGNALRRGGDAITSGVAGVNRSIDGGQASARRTYNDLRQSVNHIGDSMGKAYRGEPQATMPRPSSTPLPAGGTRLQSYPAKTAPANFSSPTGYTNVSR